MTRETSAALMPEVRRVCVVTGTRADYGLLHPLLQELQRSPALELQLLVTGAHLSPTFGLTVREIEADGFPIHARVDLQLGSDSAMAVVKSMGVGMIGFADAFARMQPHMVLVLGDRYEIFAAATAAMVMSIPVVHISGGEVTEGAIDDAFRHAITKLSQLHLVAADEYQARVLQLGEEPEHVHVVGGLGVDALRQVTLLDRPALEQALGIPLGRRSLLITYHPETLDPGASPGHLEELLAALAARTDTTLIFTMPNADAGNRVLAEMMRTFAASRPMARCYDSLGQQRYLSCLAQVDAVVGNSSSGIAEAPSLRVGTVNIGDRQRGRARASSVIDCPPNRAAIAAALDRVYSPAFRETLRTTQNPYGNGGASRRIARILEAVNPAALLRKSFRDR